MLAVQGIETAAAGLPGPNKTYSQPIMKGRDIVVARRNDYFAPRIEEAYPITARVSKSDFAFVLQSGV
jgi:hypothetical protein